MNHPSLSPVHAFVGPAALMKMAYAGANLTPVGEALLASAGSVPGASSADALLDLSTILQLNGNCETALLVQTEALRLKRLYHLPAPRGTTGIRLLALMTPGNLMTNMPLDFLLEDSDIALDILYVAPHLPALDTVPDHDVLFVAIGESDETLPLLEQLGEALKHWPRPVLNQADRCTWLSRDRACKLLGGLPGVAMPATARLTRTELENIGNDTVPVHGYLSGAAFPLIVRPVGSHAGQGLEKVESPVGLLNYLQTMQKDLFYISRFIDYSSPDGSFRKYRIVLIEGKPHAVHMGVSAHWMIHYVNAGMAESADKRAEEARFMAEFDTAFARRHAMALQAIHRQMRLDYLVIDCAETQDGKLLLFEVDNSAVVHTMDPIDIFPYKRPQMRKVFDSFRAMLAHAAGQRPARLVAQPALDALPATARLLVAGGDDRIALDPLRGVNRYGCRPTPDPDLLDFASATASVISTAAFQAADLLRARLEQDIRHLAPDTVYARELARIRGEWLELCGLGDLPAPDIIFAPSGTDLHRIAAQLAQAASAHPLFAVMVGETETGSGVSAAITGTHHGIEVATVALRNADGVPRPAREIDAEFSALALQAHAAGRHVLLIQTDVSKTGMIAPSYGCSAALQQALGTRLDILIDACQFRIAPATLRACLAQGYSVALTGSKFVGGPSFSGVLMIPAGTAGRIRKRPFPRQLATHSGAADWPDGWPVQEVLETSSNFGLLLRLDAALCELRAFRALPDADVIRFLQAFATAIQARLDDNPSFSPVAVPGLDRSALPAQSSWDHVRTIFPFQLYRSTASGRRPLDAEETQRVYRGLPAAATHCQLSQPVKYSAGLNALRICASARLVVQGVAHDGAYADVIIARALAVLDQAACLAGSV
jgi:hypothetical protein